MPFNGSGIFSRLYNWITDRNNGVKIRADRMDAEFDGIATALTTVRTESLRKDGTVTPTANQPMGGFRLTGLGTATNPTDGLSKRAMDKVLTTAGTASAYTLATDYGFTDATIYDGAILFLTAHVAGNAGPTMTVDTMTARAIVRSNGTSPAAAEIALNARYILMWHAATTTWRLVNIPAALGPRVETFTSSGTWTKSSGDQFVMVEGWGAGGGGGSGRRGAAGSDRYGGGGGGGGAYVSRLFLASELGSSETVTIGAGGAGGAARTANDTSGAAGTVGGNTSFGSVLVAYGGGGGSSGATSNADPAGGGGALAAGTTSTNGEPASTGFGGMYSAPSGWGGGSGARSATTNGASSFQGGPGGGGGAIISSANAVTAATPGGSNVGRDSGGGAAGTTGAAGSAGTGRRGGGGGGEGTSAAAGAGGAGGQPGGGGGGGGASLNGNNSGAGGAGGAGMMRVYTW